MNISKYLLLILVIMPAIPAAAQQGGAAVALVTSVRGGVTLSQGGKESPLALGTRVEEGASVRVAAGSASLVFSTGELVSLEDGEELKLGASIERSLLNAGGSTRGLLDEDGIVVGDGAFGSDDEDDVWQAQLASVSGIRGDALAIAVSPRLTVAEPKPVFCWFDTDSSAVGAERSWTLVLKDEKGTALLTQNVKGKVGAFNTWRAERLPEGFRADAGRRYSWGVFSPGTAVSEGELEAVFMFVDIDGMEHAAAQRAKLSGLKETSAVDEMTFHMLSSTFALDERERLFSDAVPHLLALGALEQGRPWAAEQLARMFLRFGGQVAALAPLASALRPEMIIR